MINYQKEIDKRRREIEELITKQQKEVAGLYPPITGRFYRLSPSIYCKVKSVDHVFDEKRSNCTVIRVVYSENNDTQLSVGNVANMTIDCEDDNQISGAEFNQVFEKAIKKIQNLK